VCNLDADKCDWKVKFESDLCFNKTRWTKVKSLPSTSTKWYSGPLLNKDVIGAKTSVDAEFQDVIYEKKFTKFLFASGDFTLWLIASKDEIVDKTTGTRVVDSSSLNNDSS
jgi:hypothetical protein